MCVLRSDISLYCLKMAFGIFFFFLQGSEKCFKYITPPPPPPFKKNSELRVYYKHLKQALSVLLNTLYKVYKTQENYMIVSSIIILGRTKPSACCRTTPHQEDAIKNRQCTSWKDVFTDFFIILLHNKYKLTA